MKNPGSMFEVHRTQSLAIESFFEDFYSAIAFVAGFGAGKSFILTVIMIISKLRYPKCDLLYLTPVYSNFRDILIPTMEEILYQTNIGYKINKTTGEIHFDVGGRIIVKSMDDPSKIIGINCLHAFLDELDTLPTNKAREVVLKARARTRQKAQKVNENGSFMFKEDKDPFYVKNKLFIATTPEGFRCTYEMFKKNKPDDYLLIQASTRDNKFLPEGYVKSMEDIYGKEMIKGYIDGEFTNLTSGTVFSEFSRDTCSSNEVFRNREPIHVGIDFNVLGISAVIYVKRESLSDQDLSIKGYAYNDKPTLVAVDHLQKVQDTPTLIILLKQKYPDSKIICYPDASGANTSTKGATVSDISLLKQAGFQCKYPKKNPAIMNRILSANSAFKNGIVKVNTDRCPDFTEALEQQIYDNKTEMPEKNAGAGTVDDITDSGTYIIYYEYPVKRKTFRAKGYQEV